MLNVVHLSKSRLRKKFKDWFHNLDCHEKVDGIILMDGEGNIVIRSLPKEQAQTYVELLTPIVQRAIDVAHDLQPSDNVELIRCITKKGEYILAVQENEFILFVYRNPERRIYRPWWEAP